MDALALDVHPRIISALKKARLSSYETILGMSTPDLQRSTQLSPSDVAMLKHAVAQAVPRLPMVTGLQLMKQEGPKELQTRYLTTGCQILNKFLHGGIVSPGLTEIAGESASGKTQLCMQLCLTAQLPVDLGGFAGGAVYICTEDAFPNRRLMQMVDLLKRRTSPEIKRINFTDSIFIEHASDIDDLMFCVKKKIPVLLEQGRVKLVVIDSIAALFRCGYVLKETMQRAKVLSSLAASLHQLSSKHGVPVVCINQISAVVSSSADSEPGKRRTIPALGIAWANLVTVRLVLTRSDRCVSTPIKDAKGNVTSHVDSVVRSMEAVFAPHLPNSICHYIIDQEGVKGLS